MKYQKYKDFLPEMTKYLSTLSNKWIIKDLKCDTEGVVINII